MVDCRDGSGDMIERLGNIVLRVIVPLRRNKGAYGADWPADAVLTRSYCLRQLSKFLRYAEEVAAARVGANTQMPVWPQMKETASNITSRRICS